MTDPKISTKEREVLFLQGVALNLPWQQKHGIPSQAMMAALESTHPSLRKGEYKNTLQLTTSCDLSHPPQSSFEEESWLQEDLGKNINQLEKACGLVTDKVGKPGFKSFLCHLSQGVLGSFLASEPPHLYQAEWGERLPQGWEVILSKRKAYKAKHHRGLPSPATFFPPYCLLSLFYICKCRRGCCWYAGRVGVSCRLEKVFSSSSAKSGIIQERMCLLGLYFC